MKRPKTRDFWNLTEFLDKMEGDEKMSYPENHAMKCKICNSLFLVDIDYDRFVFSATYEQLISCYGSVLENLNKSNLSTHFRRTPMKTKELWKHMNALLDCKENEKVGVEIFKHYGQGHAWFELKRRRILRS